MNDSLQPGFQLEAIREIRENDPLDHSTKTIFFFDADDTTKEDCKYFDKSNQAYMNKEWTCLRYPEDHAEYTKDSTQR